MTNGPKRLKIGIVCYPTHGGSGVVAMEIAHGLAARGHQVHVMSYAEPARLDLSLENITFHCVRVPDYPLFEYPPYSLALAAKMSEVVLEENLDVLHVHYAIPHAVSAWLARKMSNRDDLPIITTLHGTDITIVGNDPSYLPITRYSLETSDAVTVVSKWLGTEVSKRVGCDCDCTVIHNFVDGGIYSSERAISADPTFHLNGEKPVLMHMSNFRPVKRVSDVVDVFLKVRETVDCQLVMIGDGPERKAMEARLQQSPYADDVTFLGVVDQAEQVLPFADVFLLPSNAESFGLAALEAQACGVPVVGYKAGGLVEVVLDGETGYLLDVDDIDGMANASKEILTSKDLRSMMGEAARSSALGRFPLEKAIPAYEDT